MKSHLFFMVYIPWMFCADAARWAVEKIPADDLSLVYPIHPAPRIRSSR